MDRAHPFGSLNDFAPGPPPRRINIEATKAVIGRLYLIADVLDPSPGGAGTRV